MLRFRAGRSLEGEEPCGARFCMWVLQYEGHPPGSQGGILRGQRISLAARRLTFRRASGSGLFPEKRSKTAPGLEYSWRGCHAGGERRTGLRILQQGLFQRQLRAFAAGAQRRTVPIRVRSFYTGRQRYKNARHSTVFIEKFGFLKSVSHKQLMCVL